MIKVLTLTTPTVIAITVAIVYVGSSKVNNALANFLLAGQVPGTSIILSPSQMMTGIAIIGGFALSRLITPLVRRGLVRFKRQNTFGPEL